MAEDTRPKSLRMTVETVDIINKILIRELQKGKRKYISTIVSEALIHYWKEHYER